VQLRLRSHVSIHIVGADTAMASFRPRPPLELRYATDTFFRKCIARPLNGGTSTFTRFWQKNTSAVPRMPNVADSILLREAVDVPACAPARFFSHNRLGKSEEEISRLAKARRNRSGIAIDRSRWCRWNRRNNPSARCNRSPSDGTLVNTHSASTWSGRWKDFGRNGLKAGTGHRSNNRKTHPRWRKQHMPAPAGTTQSNRRMCYRRRRTQKRRLRFYTTHRHSIHHCTDR